MTRDASLNDCRFSRWTHAMLSLFIYFGVPTIGAWFIYGQGVAAFTVSVLCILCMVTGAYILAIPVRISLFILEDIL